MISLHSSCYYVLLQNNIFIQFIQFIIKSHIIQQGKVKGYWAQASN